MRRPPKGFGVSAPNSLTRLSEPMVPAGDEGASVYHPLHRIEGAVEAAERHLALRGITGVSWRNDLDGVGEGGRTRCLDRRTGDQQQRVQEHE